MQRLNSLDAEFIAAEDVDPHTSMGIASIAIFEGPPPTYEEFATSLGGRLPLVPRYRQKLRMVPFDLGPPVWVDAPNFDLRYHLRETALPPPGGDEELRHLVARVMTQRLDRAYPLWEYWLVKGLDGDRWALISKVHHCMVDGVSGTDLYRLIFDASPEPSPAPHDDRRPVTGEPTDVALVTRAAIDDVLLPARGARDLATALGHPDRVVRGTVDFMRGLSRLAAALRPATASSLSGAIGRQRRCTWVRTSLDDVKTVKRQLGGTVNDVVLAAITRGYRDLLLARGEEPGPRMVPSLIPVSLRAPGEEDIYENRVSALIAHLPVHVADPVERLAAVRAELFALKDSKESAVGESVTAIAERLPFRFTSRVVRSALRFPQHAIVTVTTNVPGPRQPLYGLGRRIVEIIPYVPISSTVRIGVAIFSYCDTVTFGITGDYASSPDIEVLAHGIEDGLAELVESANARH